MDERPGLRERKKRATRATIAEVAMRLFIERGFDAVTVAEIADAADVSKVTLFKYFPTKQSLVLDAAADDDPARIVAERSPGESPVDALRRYYRAFAADAAIGSVDELVAVLGVITDSPALTAGMRRIFDGQQDALAETLAAESGADISDLTPHLVAAQISATVLALKIGFFRRLAAGAPAAEAIAALSTDTDHAFDLLEHGVGDRYTR